MQGMIHTGCEAVDMMGEINLTGNVTPTIWYRTILRENGKPHLLAICILSEICYWYRPTEIRDVQTGQLIGFKKKFKGDLLQKDYRSLAEFFGESKASVKAAMDKLEEMRLIKRVWRDHKSGGRLITNILYIDLNVERLYDITFGRDAMDMIQDQVAAAKPMELFDDIEETEKTETFEPLPQNYEGGGAKFQGSLPKSFMGGGARFQGILPQNNTGGGTNHCRISSEQKEGGSVKFSGTNTENTKEITTENNSHRAHTIPSDPIRSDRKESENNKTKSCKNKRVEEVRKDIRDRIGFDLLENDERFNKGIVNELVEIMVEVYVAEKDVNISGAIIPYSLICERFDQYDFLLMEYVLFSLSENKSKVGNMKKYLLATLFNAPVTCENYYISEASRIT